MFSIFFIKPNRRAAKNMPMMLPFPPAEGSAQNNRANAIDAVRCASRTGTDQGAGSGNDAADHCENTGTDITEEVDPFHRNTRYLCNRCVRAACSDIDAETSVFVYQIPRNQQYCHNPDRIRNSEDGTAGDHFERFMGNIHDIFAIGYQIGYSFESEHGGQCGNEGGNFHVYHQSAVYQSAANANQQRQNHRSDGSDIQLCQSYADDNRGQRVNRTG